MARVIKMDGFRQAKQSQYIKRNRARLDAFIKSRVPLGGAKDMIRVVEQYQRQCSGHQELVWDYVELREMMLQIVTENIAKDLYKELEKQFWFDARWVTLEAVAERCYSHMIIGENSGAAVASPK